VKSFPWTRAISIPAERQRRSSRSSYFFYFLVESGKRGRFFLSFPFSLVFSFFLFLLGLTVASTSRTIALPREARATPAWPALAQASCCRF